MLWPPTVQGDCCFQVLVGGRGGLQYLCYWFLVRIQTKLLNTTDIIKSAFVGVV